MKQLPVIALRSTAGFFAALLIALLALAPSPTLAATATVFDAKQVVCQINAIRAQNKLPLLGLSTQLVTSAQAHSADMAVMGRVSTIGSDGSGPGVRAERAGFNYLMINELVGGGYRSSTELLTWIKGDPRLLNILLNKDAEQVGVGMARNSRDYPYWTIDIGTDWIGSGNIPTC